MHSLFPHSNRSKCNRYPSNFVQSVTSFATSSCLSTKSNTKLTKNLNARLETLPQTVINEHTSNQFLNDSDLMMNKYCFALRNSSAHTLNQTQSVAASLTASSTELCCTTDYEERRLLNASMQKKQNLVCLTDGSSTSYKYMNQNNTSDCMTNNKTNADNTNLVEEVSVSYKCDDSSYNYPVHNNLNNNAHLATNNINYEKYDLRAWSFLYFL